MSIKSIFFKVAKKHLFILIIGILLAGLSIGVSLAVPFITQSAIDEGIIQKNIELLACLSFLLVGLTVLSYILELLNTYIFAKVSKEFTKAVFDKILSNLCLKKHNFFVEQNSGEINQRINEAWDLEDIFSPEFFNSIFSLPSLIAAVVVLINTNVQITVITIVGVILSIMFLGLSNAYIGKNMSTLLDKRVNVNSKIQEIIIGIFEIRSNSAQKKFAKKANVAIDDKCNNSLKFTMGVTSFMRASNICASILSIVLLYLSGSNIIEGTLTIGTYFLIAEYVQKIIEPLMQLTGLIGQLKPLLVTSKRIEDKFKIDKEDFEQFDYVTSKKILEVSEISINNISFTYPGNKFPTISSFNLTSRIGETVIIKGANGSGKSTLLNLVSGELKCDSGEILFDGISGISNNCLSVTHQRPFIFNLSLKENIVLSEEYSENKYLSILNKLRFIDYFDSDILNNSIQIKENGKSLSGGQIQLIALARCLYRSRSIIIFDEVLSNLDINLRKIVLDYVEEVKKNHILILVEHTNDFDSLADIIINLPNKEENE